MGLRSFFGRRGKVFGVSVAAVAATMLFSPPSAKADVSCSGFEQCGNPIPSFVVMIQSADAASLGLVSIIGSGVTVARNKEAGTGWLAVGYLGAAYNLTIGTVWTTTAVDIINAGGASTGWGHFQAVLGGVNLALGITALGLTLKAHSQSGAETSPEYARLPPVLPSFAPLPGGGLLTLSGNL